MAKNLVLEDDAVNAEADALAALCDSGYIRLYTVGDTLLAELRFGATAFPAASAGVLTANAITGEDSCLADGTATKYSVYQSDGTSKLWTGTVDTSNADLVVSNNVISTGAQFNISTFVHTVPKSA